MREDGPAAVYPRRLKRSLVAGIVGVLLVAAGVGAVLWRWSTRDGAQRVAGPAVSATVSAVPATTVDEKTAAAIGEVLRTYAAANTAYEAASAVPDSNSPELKKYYGHPLLGNIVLNLYKVETNGAVYRGPVVHRPRVTEVRLTAERPTATIEDCVDYSGRSLVYKSNSSPVVVPSGNRRYIVITTAAFAAERGWLLTDSDPQRENAC